ncbi:MAG: putative integral rane protein [Marmoricola sp.]|nr:putative integral rane protein [Marmoricola sp.]
MTSALGWRHSAVLGFGVLPVLVGAANGRVVRAVPAVPPRTLVTGLLCALGAALCYGIGSVLQAAAARDTQRSDSLDPRLLLRLAGSRAYVLGVVLDGTGFVLTLAAARALPLFVVQSVVACFLAVTAVLGTVFLRAPLHPRDRLGLGLVLVGLVLVALSARAESPVQVNDSLQWATLAGVVLLVGAGTFVGRLGGAHGALPLGAVAGLAFGATSVGARMLPAGPEGADLLARAVHVLAQPATWAIVVAGGLGMLAYSSALQRGSVTRATAPLVVGETVAPALVGLWFLGDQSRPGWQWAAVAGFVLAVVGALSLSRYGEAIEPSRQSAEEGIA